MLLQHTLSRSLLPLLVGRRRRRRLTMSQTLILSLLSVIQR